MPTGSSNVRPARSSNPPPARTSNLPPARSSNPPPARRSNQVVPNPHPGKSRTLPANAPKRGNRTQIDEDEDDGDVPTNIKRRRNGDLRKRAKKSKARKRNVDNEDGECFDLDGQPDDGDDGEGDRGNDTMDHQLGYYQGFMKKLVLHAIFFMRIFLLNMNAYPEKEELMKWGGESIRSGLPGGFWVEL